MSATVEKETRKRYLDLIEATVSNSIYGESGIERKIHAFWQRLRHPLLTKRGVFGWPPRAHTMLRAERLKNIRMLVEAVIEKGIPGDLIETGVWRGGACIYMRAILAAHGQSERKVVVADSFEGLPPPDGKKYPADKRDKLSTFDELAVSLDDVKRNFAAYGLLDSQVQFAKGFFKDTLGKLDNERFALIRLDGDMYESTMDALTALYDKVSRAAMSSWTTMAASPLAVRPCMIFLTSGGWHPKSTKWTCPQSGGKRKIGIEPQEPDAEGDGLSSFVALGVTAAEIDRILYGCGCSMKWRRTKSSIGPVNEPASDLILSSSQSHHRIGAASR